MTAELFSYYKHKVTDPTPSESISVPQLIDLVKSDKYKEAVLKIRATKSKDDQRKLKKETLDYVTVGGVFSYRAEQNLETPSGLMCIDIDSLANPVEVQKQKDLMKKNKYVHAYFTSPSGVGLKIIVRIPPEKENYQKYFVGFYGEFTDIDPMQFDSGTRNIAHACFLSHDPFPYYNPDSVIFDKKKEVKEICPVEANWSVVESALQTDRSRSGYEFREIVTLIRGGANKDEIFKTCASYCDKKVVWGKNSDGEDVIAWEKWNHSESHYRDTTYAKAKKYCDDHPVSSKPKVRLPATAKSTVARTIGTFAKEVGQIFSSKNQLFFNITLKLCVEIRLIHDKENRDITYLGFVILLPNRFVTLVEDHIFVYSTITREIEEDGEKGVEKKDVEKNMSVTVAALTVASDQFMEELPRIRRIFTVPIPILYKGGLAFPKKGYDPRFESWLDPNSPELADVSYEEAVSTINYLFSEFCFKDAEQDKTHAIAALLTPFLRGLYPSFNERTPLFIYLANRERAGKDFCAGITGITYEGVAREDTPLSEAGDGKFTNSTKSDELRKKICSAMISGRKRMHFSNCKGHLDNTILEQIITNKTFADRLLGKNEELIMDNEMDFSLSGNLGISYTPDVEQRSRVIHFMLNIEDPNTRSFVNPNLHGWVLENRSKILGSMFTLVKRWHEAGMPEGKTPFASFPGWARVCGGIMVANGLGDPCRGQESLVTGGNVVDRDMKILWELGYKDYKDAPFLKSDLIDKMAGEKGWLATEEIFADLVGLRQSEMSKQMGDRVAFSKMFINHVGREYGKIKLIIYEKKAEREALQRYVFKNLVEDEVVE